MGWSGLSAPSRDGYRVADSVISRGASQAASSRARGMRLPSPLVPLLPCAQAPELCVISSSARVPCPGKTVALGLASSARLGLRRPRLPGAAEFLLAARQSPSGCALLRERGSTWYSGWAGPLVVLDLSLAMARAATVLSKASSYVFALVPAYGVCGSSKKGSLWGN